MEVILLLIQIDKKNGRVTGIKEDWYLYLDEQDKIKHFGETGPIHVLVHEKIR